MGRNYIPVVPTSDNPWENLANEIVIQACSDYKQALIKLRKDPWNHNALSDKRVLERFFRSQWFGVLTICNGIDGEWLMRKIKETVNK